MKQIRSLRIQRKETPKTLLFIRLIGDGIKRYQTHFSPFRKPSPVSAKTHIPQETSVHINFPCPVFPFFASFSLSFNCCNSKSCLSFFSISTNSCLTASTQTSMTSDPTLQVRNTTPSLSMTDFALAHLLFHSSSFLLRMGPPSGSSGSWKEESFHAPLRRFVA